jgi:hypothetical protein
LSSGAPAKEQAGDFVAAMMAVARLLLGADLAGARISVARAAGVKARGISLGL